MMGDDDDGTYPSYDRPWKKREIQGQVKAYEGKAPKAENAAREEKAPTTKGMRRR
jgi:hypothetical protein